MAFIIQSAGFAKNELIPARYTCDGKNISLPLEWSGVPMHTKSFALIMDDPEAPAQTWVHWVLYNIPADTQELKEDIPSEKKLADGALHGINDFKNYGYGGPCPPSGTHHYFLKLYALDTLPDLNPGLTKQQLLDAADGHVLAKAQLIGKYKRQK